MKDAVSHICIDLVIDFEPNGLRTAVLSRWLGRLVKAPAVGVAQFPLRRFFYDLAAPSNRSFAKKYGLAMPMDYANRDFVVLDGLGIARGKRLPELTVSNSGLTWAAKYLAQGEKRLQVTLNIGCGTEGALPRRPPLDRVSEALAALYRSRPFVLYLAGAEFEFQVNESFKALFLAKIAGGAEVINFAGTGDLCELTGLLAASDLVISSDSGPYHMAVALDRPTVCWFVLHTPEAHHLSTTVKLLLRPDAERFVAAVNALLAESLR